MYEPYADQRNCPVVENPASSCVIVVISNIETNSVALARERTTPSKRPPRVGEVPANCCGYRLLRRQHNGSLGRNLGFLDRSRYFFFQVAPQLYSRR
jgi:hypothetical protein